MPETVGIYYRDDEMDELEAFDKVANRHQDRIGYSRSRAVRESMDMSQLVLETLERIETPEDMSKTMREVLVEEAILRMGQPDEG